MHGYLVRGGEPASTLRLRIYAPAVPSSSEKVLIAKIMRWLSLRSQERPAVGATVRSPGTESREGGYSENSWMGAGRGG